MSFASTTVTQHNVGLLCALCLCCSSTVVSAAQGITRYSMTQTSAQGWDNAHIAFAAKDKAKDAQKDSSQAGNDATSSNTAGTTLLDKRKMREDTPRPGQPAPRQVNRKLTPDELRQLRREVLDANRELFRGK